MTRHLRAAEQEVEVDVANPMAVIRDEWLANKDSIIGTKHVSIAFSGLQYLLAANLSESRMGVIQGLPSLPRGASLFTNL